MQILIKTKIKKCNSLDFLLQQFSCNYYIKSVVVNVVFAQIIEEFITTKNTAFVVKIVEMFLGFMFSNKYFL